MLMKDSAVQKKKTAKKFIKTLRNCRGWRQRASSGFSQDVPLSRNASHYIPGKSMTVATLSVVPDYFLVFLFHRLSWRFPVPHLRARQVFV
ncbi:hypothetical protein CDAR_379181 [Caerostris darwini]|uniref:Uncharacterized protein n=1 Tax=Caerostris darwini TaxID=1538125 RepID=A0AAV4R3D4_9ARAC|nr:hypothetical protein CDAR_379181 [Caerostris darwini]